MADQGQVLINTETPLATSENVANVAVNQAAAKERKAMNVDGQEIFPEKVYTNDLVLKTALSVGSGVQIMDGTITSEMIGADQVNASHIFAEGLTTSDITFDGGQLSDFGISTLGTISGGSLDIAGDVSLGSSGGGFYIGNNMLIAYSGGSPTVTIDGGTGIITASKVVMTLASGSTMDTRLASLTIGDDTSVEGTTTIAAINTAAVTGASKAQTYYQASTPTAQNVGDLWYDTSSNELRRWNGSVWTSQIIGNVTNTFAQTSQPSSGMVAGDLWIDTDDYFRIYRYNGSSWVAAAPTFGGYLDVSSGQVTNIDVSGITVGTATSGARVQINSTGVAVYNSSNALCTWMDTDGFHVKRQYTDFPTNEYERASFHAYSGYEYGFICASRYDNGGLVVAGYDGNLYLEGGLYPSGSSWTWHDYDIELYSGGDIFLCPGRAGGTNVVSVGRNTSGLQDETLEVWNRIDMRGTGCNIRFGGSGGPSIYAVGAAPTFSAAKGSLCIDYGNAVLYINTTGSTTWAAV